MAALRLDIDTAAADPNLLGAALGDLSTWAAWRAVLKATFGLSLKDDEARVFADVAGCRAAPERRVRELWAVIGRRSGKSRVAALVASYLAAFVDYTGRLAPGEVGCVLVLAASVRQAHVVFGYVKAFFESSPLLSQLVEDVTSDELRLKGNIVIGVHTASHKTIRGRTLLACVFDEVGFWRDEASSQPDVEVYRAVLPGLSTTKGMLIGISSPYAQRGLLYTKHQAAFGKNDPDVLVIQAPTLQFNPTFDPEVIAAASREDPESARAEWNAEFRGDLSTFVDRAVVEATVEAGVNERPFQLRYRYFAFCDPSGGSHDSAALAIAHRDGERVVLDLAREWKAPFSPTDVVEDMAAILKRYRLGAVSGDAYSAQWIVDAFRLHGIAYRHAERNRSELYLELLPLLTSGGAVLLDLPRLVGQIAQLERRTGRTGKDAVDHMRGAYDDLANAAAGALVNATTLRGTVEGFNRRRSQQAAVANTGGRTLCTVPKEAGGLFVGNTMMPRSERF